MGRLRAPILRNRKGIDNIASTGRLLRKIKICCVKQCVFGWDKSSTKSSDFIVRPVLGCDDSGGPSVAKNLNGVADGDGAALCLRRNDDMLNLPVLRTFY